MKGKNFSGNNMGQRRKSDLYETPYSITEQLLEREVFEGQILEPACGNGAMSSVLARKRSVVSYDQDVDFLKETRRFPNIVTNPPYSLAFEFIQKAKQIATEKFCFLLPLSYLHGQKRFTHIWQDRAFPLARIYVFTRYPILGENLREDGKYHTGMMVYAWYVWSKSHRGNPQIRWINNNEYVI